MIPPGHVCSKKVELMKKLAKINCFDAKVICPKQRGSFFYTLCVMQFIASMIEIWLAVCVWVLMGMEDVEIKITWLVVSYSICSLISPFSGFILLFFRYKWIAFFLIGLHSVFGSFLLAMIYCFFFNTDETVVYDSM